MKRALDSLLADGSKRGVKSTLSGTPLGLVLIEAQGTDGSQRINPRKAKLCQTSNPGLIFGLKLNRAQCVLACVRDSSDAGRADSNPKATAWMTPNHTPKLTTDGDRSIGSRIAAYRSAQGLSQTALGQALGITFQQVQKYEKGRNRVGAARLQAIADFLGVPISTFFDDPSAIADGREPVPHLLQDPDVMELVRTFSTITDKTTRRNVLSIVKAAATLSMGPASMPD